MGNYYGAAATSIAVFDNSYTVHFRSGVPGSSTSVTALEPVLPTLSLTNLVKAGAVGSGDNAYIYGAPNSAKRVITGTIPPNREDFTIKGAIPNPHKVFAEAFRTELKAAGIAIQNKQLQRTAHDKSMARHKSPTLKEIATITNHKSVNLFAEAIHNAIGKTAAIKEAWKKKEIDLATASLRDGSGVSPKNRSSACQLATVMAHSAKNKNFIETLTQSEETPNLRYKSGSMSGVKAFTGVISGKSPRGFAIIANDYAGSGSQVKKALLSAINDISRS